MRILVLSDSHSDVSSLKYAVDNEPSAEAVLFLGDGLRDFEEIKNKRAGVYCSAVRGNCDSAFCPYPLFSQEALGGKTIYMSHGQSEHVKYGIEELKSTARLYGADIALYGHTHVPFVDYDDGLYIMNPGSVRENSCGIIDITDSGGVICYTKPIFNIVTDCR